MDTARSSQETDHHTLRFSRLGVLEVTGQAREDAAVTAGDSCHGWDCASSWPTPQISCVASLGILLAMHIQAEREFRG